MPAKHAIPSALLAIAGALAACVLLAACGGSSASTDPSSASASAANDAIKFARCMREHGIHVETSTEGGATQMRIQSQGGPGEGGPNQHSLEEAQKDCQRYQPGEGSAPKFTPQEKVAHEEAIRKFAKCMREHGIHVETSTSGGGFAVRVGGKPGEGGPNPESPTFEKAQEACQSLLPGPKGGFPKHLPKLPRKAPGGGGHAEAGHSGAVLSIGAS